MSQSKRIIIIRQKKPFFLILYGFCFYSFLSILFNLLLAVLLKFSDVWRRTTVFIGHFTTGGPIMFILKLPVLIGSIILFLFLTGVIFLSSIQELFSKTVIDFDKGKIKFQTIFRNFIFDRNEISCYKVSFVHSHYTQYWLLSVYADLLFNDGRFFSFKMPITSKTSDPITYGKWFDSFFGTRETWLEGKRVELEEKSLSRKWWSISRLKLDLMGYCWLRKRE